MSFLCRREAEGREGLPTTQDQDLEDVSVTVAAPGGLLLTRAWSQEEEPLLSYCEGQATGLQGLGGWPWPQGTLIANMAH